MGRQSRLITSMGFVGALVFAVAVPALAVHAMQREQRPSNPPRANQGHVPPPPPHRTNAAEARAVERLPNGKTDERQHVNNDTWYGHDAVNDARFKLAHPYPHGRFAKVGPNFRWAVARVDLNAHRFWLTGGGFFEVAAWDWALCADWAWTNADDFVLYDDPDHPGWYLVYNVQTGEYAHCQYMGT